MKIWIFNNYNMLPDQGGLNRHYFLGKYLEKAGHEPVVFVGSHPHNSNIQLIEGKERYKTYFEKPFPWVLIKTCNYEESKLKRIYSMFQYYRNAKKAAKNFEKPDAIVGSSAHPLAALLAIKLGKKYGCKKIVEVRDLWPESIAVYGILKRSNPLIKLLYRFEKRLYMNADRVVFTMEGAYDYIKAQGWEKDIPREKVFYINNGVDIQYFDENKNSYNIEDTDLDNPDNFNVVYTGSVRRVNNIDLLLDAAKKVKNKKIVFTVWGNGNEVDMLKKRIEDEHIDNVRLKGYVDKKYIPSIVCRADLNFAHNEASELFRYGISFNKVFDYLAAGKPVLFDFPCPYNPAIINGGGIEVADPTADNIAKAIDDISEMNEKEYSEYAVAARKTAEEYDFEILAKKLVSICERVKVQR